MESVQISPCGLICLQTREELMLLNFEVTSLPKSYLWKKNEGNLFFNSCHSILAISWPSLLSSILTLLKINVIYVELF